MRRPGTALACAALLLAGAGARAADTSPLPPGDKKPVLRLEAGGPTAFVTALAFGKDGRTLYAAGWDKVVRVWALKDKRFVLQEQAFRVPLGPGLEGALNALAVSEDGEWLAVGGKGVYRGDVNFRDFAAVVPTSSLTAEMLRDQGLISVFNTRTGEVQLLRGTEGEVFALAFAPPRGEGPPLLVAAGRERDEATKKYKGVLRLWDVSRGQSLYRFQILDEDPLGLSPPKPNLAVWYSQARNRPLQVALTWGGSLAVWTDPDVRPRIVPDAGGGGNPLRYDPLVYVPGQGRLLTAAFGPGKPRLKAWDVDPGAEPGEVDELPRAQASDATRFVTPWVLAPVSARSDGQVDLVATVTWKETKQQRQFQYALQLLWAGQGNRGTLAGEVPLWQDSFKRPALATCLGGKFLAVAGNSGPEIRLYRVEDLLAGKKEPAQTLRSEGTTIGGVAFARQGKQIGLLLREDPPEHPAADFGLVFDFGKRRLTDDLTGWQVDAPPRGEWRVEPPEGTEVVVYRGEKAVQRIRLPGKVSYPPALLQPREPLRKPLLALAYQEAGLPVLCLYDAESGQRLREFAGHEDRIRALAFSGDGRYLVSSSEDQTVRVWALADLDELLGKQGLLVGVAVTDSGEGPVVSSVAEDSPSREKLSPGDVIEGVVREGRLRRLGRAWDLYEAVADIAPGKPVTLRVRGKPDVTLRVGQRVDLSKPLLSLFLPRSEKGREPRWIGWSPLGPYETSDPEAERHLGWHFNTGDPAAPARFASADQYHRDYYREGLLKKLIDAGKFVLLPPPPPPRPTIGLALDAGGQFVRPDARRQHLVRRPDPTLRVQITGRRPDVQEAVTWRVDDDGPEQAFDPDQVAGGFLAAPLSLSRGVHKVVVTVRPPDAGPEGYREELLVRYQPPPPRVEYQGKPPAVVRTDAFRLSASVFAGRAGEAFTVRLFREHAGKREEVAREDYEALPAGRPGTFAPQVDLPLGTSNLDLVAVNRNALGGYEGAETSQLHLEVTRTEKPDPPTIALDVEVGPGELAPSPRGGRITVGVPRSASAGRSRPSSR